MLFGFSTRDRHARRIISVDVQRITLNASSCITISGGRTEQLYIIAGFLQRHWLYEWFSQFHSCGTYSFLSRSHSVAFLPKSGAYIYCQFRTESGPGYSSAFGLGPPPQTSRWINAIYRRRTRRKALPRGGWLALGSRIFLTVFNTPMTVLVWHWFRTRTFMGLVSLPLRFGVIQ